MLQFQNLYFWKFLLHLINQHKAHAPYNLQASISLRYKYKKGNVVQTATYIHTYKWNNMCCIATQGHAEKLPLFKSLLFNNSYSIVACVAASCCSRCGCTKALCSHLDVYAQIYMYVYTACPCPATQRFDVVSASLVGVDLSGWLWQHQLPACATNHTFTTACVLDCVRLRSRRSCEWAHTLTFCLTPH